MQAPSLSYVTAPATSGSQYAPQTVSLPLTQSTQTAWTQKGTTINATNPLSASTTERWSTQTATWTTQTPNQIAQTITYYQQYAVTFSYQAIGGTLPSTPTFTAVSYNQIKTIELTLTESSYWLDADSAYVVTSVLESSSASERWITNRPSGTISSELSVTANYYHQFNVPVDYASADENETVTFNYFSLGTLNSIELSSVPVQIWADAQATFTTNSINNTAYERWSALPDSGTIQNASAIHITLQHQYLLTIFGAQTSSQWVNSDQTVQLSFQTVLNRALGTGQRISAYTLDQGSAVTVSAATQNINIPILMDTSHQLRISTITQYQISIDAFAAQLLSSITPPTVSGDNYWYDSGTQVSVVLKGLGTRVGGVGTRLADYTVNDAQTSAATTDQVIVLNTTITAPQSISATLVTQYQLTTTAGSINTITEPTLPQDNGWYDAQTPVTITLNQVWNVTDNSRTIATAYTINQNSMPLTQSGNETFTIQVVMNSNKQITVTSVVQNRLTITGGHNVTVSQASPTGDDFYNSNTIVSVYVNTEWDTTESSKQVVSSYTLDGVTSSVSQTEPLLSIELSMDKAHELVFSSGLRCLVSFTIKDNSGTETLTPEVLQISLGNSTVDVENYDAWVMEQTQFQIGNVIWQGVDVKPQTQESYTVTGPLEVTVFCRVFNATIKLTDNNGATIENAQVIVTLANQTIVEAVTNGEGTVDLGMIPQGTFNATVIYKDKTITLTGDASVQAVTAGVIHLQNNYFIESVVFAVILFVIIACVLLIIIKQRAGK
jgi:hypothetical protein